MEQTSASHRERDSDIFDVVHARILRFFPQLVSQCGGDPAALMARVGIGLTDEKLGATYRQVVELLEIAAAELACPDFGLRLAKLQSGCSMFGPLGLVMRNSRTLGEALDYVATHSYAHSLAARIWFQPLADQGGVFVGHDILLDRMPSRAQAMEQILLVGHLAALELTGGRARVRQVRFRHQPASPARAYRRYFGCEVAFGQNADGVLFSDRDLAAPILEPDTTTYAKATAYVETGFSRRSPPLHAEVRALVMRLLRTGQCSAGQVAAALDLHPRTMHRRLQNEGASFRSIKDEVRRDLLLYYIRETDLDFTRISEFLGYAEQSVMTRTAQRWFHASPSRLRMQAREGVGTS